MFTFELFIIFIMILLVCMIGFKKYVWFISLGYGFSISIVGVMLLILFWNQLDIGYILGAVTLICYGIRLGGFLAIREIKSSTYNSKMKKEISDGKNMKFPIKVILWLSCALLYLFMTSPIIFRFINNSGTDNIYYIGLIITILGIFLEALSDFQKSKAKKNNPNRFVDTGLFKLVRCPNYLGELIIWLGVFVSGVSSLTGIGQWILSIIGFIGIIYIMFSGARRLELRQDRTYGKDIDYQKYSKSTPILIPFIPLYSVKKYKWLVG